MSTPKLLFVDDRWQRMEYALKHYSDKYEVVLAPNFQEAMRQLCGQDFDIVSLDHDLNGNDFESPDSPSCGMSIISYIEKTKWPKQRRRPKFRIHSMNLFAGTAMKERLLNLGFEAEFLPLTWKQYQHGVVAGAFDVMHPGYVRLLKEAKDLCHKVTVLIHDKPNQVFNIIHRIEVLYALRYVDDVIPYETEEELTELLLKLKPDVRIEGSDHRGRSTRPDLPIRTHYHIRSHDWSATMYKEMIAKKVGEK